MRKAYNVENTASGDRCSCIVFAETGTKAKTAAHYADGFDCEWTSLTAKRYPQADRYESTHSGALVEWRGAGLRIYYELGWQLNEARTCEECYRFECDSIPESIINDHEDEEELCVYCRSARAEAPSIVIPKS